MVLSILLAFAALYAYNLRRIQAADFALGKQNTSRTESVEGRPITAHSVPGIVALVKSHATPSATPDGARRRLVAWFGNSQLHTLNQYKDGQHLAPLWMRRITECGACLEPLGLSLANANPQEIHALSTYVAHHLALSAVIVEVEFMGFREDALRGDFKQLATEPVIQLLGDTSVGHELAALRQVAATAPEAKTPQANEGLDGALQKKVEDTLTQALGGVWPLWADRAYLRSNLLGDLFTLRNSVFNISSQSQRKIIRPRYVRNIAAFQGMLAHFQKAGIPLILYIAPIRGDKPLPYDRDEYESWKTEVAEHARKHGAELLNLESLVPAQDWGSNFGDDIDFMHFQEPGHKLVAQALWPVVRKATGL